MSHIKKIGEMEYTESINRKILTHIKTDLKTELTPAMAFCDLLLFENYGELKPVQRDRIQKINNHLKNIHKISSAILDKNSSGILECQEECVIGSKTTYELYHKGECIFAILNDKSNYN